MEEVVIRSGLVDVMIGGTGIAYVFSSGDLDSRLPPCCKLTAGVETSRGIGPADGSKEKTEASYLRRCLCHLLDEWLAAYRLNSLSSLEMVRDLALTSIGNINACPSSGTGGSKPSVGTTIGTLDELATRALEDRMSEAKNSRTGISAVLMLEDWRVS